MYDKAVCKTHNSRTNAETQHNYVLLQHCNRIPTLKANLISDFMSQVDKRAVAF